jgi:DegV family protein with EDD domain
MNKQKQKTGLVVDDICSLPAKLLEELQIEVVKTKLFFPEWGKNPEKNLYQVMAKTKAHPKTSAPSPGDYLKAYKKALEKFEKVLVITLTSELSATYSSARQAKELMPDSSKISIFNSLQASVPEGLLTLKAAELIKEGQNIEEITKTLENLREKVKLFGFLETTYWVEKIGRMSHWQATAFKILKGLGVQPMIGIKKGKVGLTGFNFWTKDVFKALFHQLKHQTKKSKIRVGINYTDNIDLAYKLKEKVEEELGAEVSFTSLAPPIVGANSGPGTLLAGCLSVDEDKSSSPPTIL